MALLVKEDGSCVETLTEDSSARSSGSATEQTSSMAEQNSSAASYTSIEEMHDALEEKGDRAALRADLQPERAPDQAAASAGLGMETPSSNNAIHFDLDEDELDTAVSGASSSNQPASARVTLDLLGTPVGTPVMQRIPLQCVAGNVYSRKTSEGAH